jgi:phosphate/sulfate permease
MKSKFSKTLAALVVSAGLIFGGGASMATAATAGLYQPTLNNCQYVTVKPKLSGPICWNVFGAFAKLPDGCYPTKVWKCYQV